MPEWFREFFGADYLQAYGRRNRREAPAEVRFIETALQMRAGRITLDLCCGEGRHAVPLALRGYRIVGLDLSPPLLEAARRSAADRGAAVDWVRADSRAIPFHRRFDAVFCWFTTFGYFSDPGDDRRVLAQVGAALRPGGVFLLEVLNREFLLRHPHEAKRIDGDSCWLDSRMVFSPAESLCRTRKTIHFPDGSRRDYTLTTRVYDRPDLTGMLAAAGFDRIEMLPGNGPGGGTTAAVPRLLRYRARRRPARRSGAA